MKNVNVTSAEMRAAKGRRNEQAAPKAKALSGDVFNEHAVLDSYDGEAGREDDLNAVQNESDTEWRRASNLEAPPRGRASFSDGSGYR